MQNLWDACLRRLEQELPAQQFNTWIRPLAPEAGAADSATLVLAAPNRFVLELVRERFAARIERLAAEAGGREIDVKLVLARSAPTRRRRGRGRLRRARPADAAVAPDRARLNRSFSFDNFVTGKANQLARAAGMQVAENPASPTTRCSSTAASGLGKTHLVQAIGNHILRQRPQARRSATSTPRQYVSDVVRAYQHKAFDEFKRYYRSLDLLLIDDIQFFCGKSRTQEEFFYLFNTLIEAHKQVVITCDTYPKEIAGIEERLISRFGWGLTVALEPPELEMRVAILLEEGARPTRLAHGRAGRLLHRQAHPLQRARARRRAEARARLRELPRPARSRSRSPRRRCATSCTCQNRQITSRTSRRRSPTTSRSSVSDMHSKKRSRNVARPRQVAMALAKELTQMSLPEIGEATSAAATTPRCCTPAGRSRSCARSDTGPEPRLPSCCEQVLKG